MCLSKPPQKNKIFELNGKLEFVRTKQHVTLNCSFEPKMWQLAPSENKHQLGADFYQSDAKNTLSLQKQPCKAWFFHEKACQDLFGAKQDITSDDLSWPKKICNETKWKQTSTCGWLLSRWCEWHTVTANTAMQNTFFQWNSMLKICEGKATCHICLFTWAKKVDHCDQVKTNIKLVLSSVRMMQKHTVAAETTTQNMIFFSKIALWKSVRAQKHVKLVCL